MEQNHLTQALSSFQILWGPINRVLICTHVAVTQLCMNGNQMTTKALF